jgi:hypothetical protein
MTEAAKKYFELYYKLQRCIDANEKDGFLANKTRKELARIYNEDDRIKNNNYLM